MTFSAGAADKDTAAWGIDNEGVVYGDVAYEKGFVRSADGQIRLLAAKDSAGKDSVWTKLYHGARGVSVGTASSADYSTWQAILLEADGKQVTFSIFAGAPVEAITAIAADGSLVGFSGQWEKGRAFKLTPVTAAPNTSFE